MQLYTRLSNCSPPLGKVLRSIAKGRRLAKVRAANPEDCVRGAWSEVMSEVLPARFQGKVAEVKLSQKARNWLLQSGAGKQEKGTEDHSTELQESERSPAEWLAKKRGMFAREREPHVMGHSRQPRRKHTKALAAAEKHI